MLNVIRSEERYVAEPGWLTSRHSFSFAEYFDSNNLQFSPLRVFNDDIVQPGKSFGTHSRQEMEIISYVVDRVLEHKDSVGNSGSLEVGEVQRLSAGCGLYHSECNHSNKDTVHFLQIWFIPGEKGLPPSWEQRKFA